ncbi:MAG: iron-sulfur cluster repair di-iron protein [Blastocatellia bacterium]
MNVNATTTIRELAAAAPGATRVFEKFGIDYCCGGHRTLFDACQTASLSVEQVVLSLAQAAANTQTGAAPRNWQNEPLAALAAYIVDQHHSFTRQELEQLERLFEKVCARHGANHPELADAQRVFRQLKQDLIPHMLKEEQVLFPYIARMEEAVSEQRDIPQPFFGTVQNPVRMMMMEHDTAGELLGELRRVTSGYAPPPDACISYQTLYQSLAAFEADLHEHIHLENNLLFPRGVEMESGAAPERAQTIKDDCERHFCGH